MKKNKKYVQILEASQKLFYRYGIRKVTVEDICREAGVSKMTFYKHFPNKIELAKCMLDSRFEYLLGQFWDIMRSDRPFAGKMQQYLELKAMSSENAGKDFGLDFYKSEDEVIKEYMNDWITRSLNETIRMFTYAQDQGWMRKDLKPELMLDVMNRMIESVRNEKLLNLYDNVQDFAMEISKFFLYGILDR